MPSVFTAPFRVSAFTEASSVWCDCSCPRGSQNDDEQPQATGEGLRRVVVEPCCRSLGGSPRSAPVGKPFQAQGGVVRVQLDAEPIPLVSFGSNGDSATAQKRIEHDTRSPLGRTSTGSTQGSGRKVSSVFPLERSPPGLATRHAQPRRTGRQQRAPNQLRGKGGEVGTLVAGGRR